MQFLPLPGEQRCTPPMTTAVHKKMPCSNCIIVLCPLCVYRTPYSRQTPAIGLKELVLLKITIVSSNANTNCLSVQLLGFTSAQCETPSTELQNRTTKALHYCTMDNIRDWTHIMTTTSAHIRTQPTTDMHTRGTQPYSKCKENRR